LLTGVSGATMAASLALAGAAAAQTSQALATSGRANLVPVALATAATPADSQVEGVVVTAERRSTSVQKTAVAVSVVSGEALDRSFINQVSGLNGIVPSLEITQANGSEQLVSIRGIGSETPENSASTTPGVSEFVDGVYIVNTVSLDETLFDIDHIEVLRGPQGDLYGESSIGGAINLVTNQPELNRFGGSGDFSFGNYDLTRERAEINLPVTDTVAIRASFQKYDHDGFTTNTYFPDTRLDDAHDVSGKVAILWKPNDTFSATLTGQWYHSDQNGAAQKNIADTDTDPRHVYQDYPGKFELTNQLYHLNLEWDLPWFNVRSVTGYQHQNFIYQYDSSRSAFSVLGAYDDVAAYNIATTAYTEQFDLLSKSGSPLEWDIGGFVLNEESTGVIDEFEGATANPDVSIPADISTNPPSNLSYGNIGRTARQGYAAFGRATYHILPKLSLTVGARINHDSYTGNSFNYSAYGSSSVSHGYNDTVPTGRVEMDYDVTNDNMVYGSVVRGYKPGGLNGKNGQAVVPETFNPETNTAFEIGSKNAFMDRTLRVNLAAFYYIYKNMQYIEYDPVPFGSGIANIPSIHEYGLEGEIAYQSRNHRLHIDGSFALENGFAEGNYKTINSTIANGIEQTPACYYGYNTACYTQVEASAESIKGKSPPDMPKFSGSVSASYLFDTPYGTLMPRAQYVYRGSEWARIFNVANLDRLDPYGVTNLNLEFIPNNSKFKMSIAATNVFNVDGVNSRFTDPYGTGQTSQEYIAPRQVIASVAYAF
jgi:iron complex outermembrane receptor protein